MRCMGFEVSFVDEDGEHHRRRWHSEEIARRDFGCVCSCGSVRWAELARVYADRTAPVAEWCAPGVPRLFPDLGGSSAGGSNG